MWITSLTSRRSRDRAPHRPLDGNGCKPAGFEGDSKPFKGSEVSSKDTKKIPLWTLSVFIAFVFVLLFTTDASAWSLAKSSYYGPGLYGNRTACGQTLTPTTAGVAHRSLPCGTKVRLKYRGRIVRVRVIDRGPYVYGRTFDIAAFTANYLCKCRNGWGVRVHYWRRGW
jgi:hypothetical protein